MRKPRKFRYNNCARCPVIGEEPEDEFYNLLWIRFNLRIAAERSRGHDLKMVDRSVLEQWIGFADINEAHLDHIPQDTGPGIMVTLPSGCGMPLIDGNHRAARSLRDGTNFVVTVLNEDETFSLLCQTIGIFRADVAWQRLANSKPHQNDK
jgi:hypothetical protein